MSAYLYPISLALISGVVLGLEVLWPWRPHQRRFRPGLFSDLLHLVFNGHFLGVGVYLVYQRAVEPMLAAGWSKLGVDPGFSGVAAAWPTWLQVLVAVFAIDFIQWCVHNLLHRVPFLWEYHKVHHSVRDGEMDWIVSFRFHWMEVVVYKSILYLPLAFFGFGLPAVLFHAIFGTLIGHLNHANLNWNYGPLRYLLNHPPMHLWHHDRDGKPSNFGIIFSCWDYLFGTAYVPKDPPRRIGFQGEESMPRNFIGHLAWPVSGARTGASTLVAAGFMVSLVVGVTLLEFAS